MVSSQPSTPLPPLSLSLSLNDQPCDLRSYYILSASFFTPSTSVLEGFPPSVLNANSEIADTLSPSFLLSVLKLVVLYYVNAYQLFHGKEH